LNNLFRNESYQQTWDVRRFKNYKLLLLFIANYIKFIHKLNINNLPLKMKNVLHKTLLLLII